MPDFRNLEPAPALADALAALPLAGPSESTWPRIEATLAARLARRRRATRWRYGLAAALALFALAPALELALTDRATAPPAPADVAATADPRDALIERSQALEASLAAYDEPVDAGSAFAAAELEDLIGMVDVQLSATDDPRHAQVLWRQRLALVEELATIRARGRYRLATIDGLATNDGPAPRAELLPASYVID
jgi:hypothetical protein